MKKSLLYVTICLFFLIPSAVSLQASTTGLCMHVSAASGSGFVDIDPGTFSLHGTNYSLGPTKRLPVGTNYTMNFYGYVTGNASSIAIAFSGSPENSKFMSNGVLIGTVISGSNGIIKSITNYISGCQNYQATSTPTTVSTPQVPAINTSRINSNLSLGMRNSDVITLQNYLISIGLLKSGATGYFGSLTLAAVKQFQAQNGISVVGNVGPITRGVINARIAAKN